MRGFRTLFVLLFIAASIPASIHGQTIVPEQETGATIALNGPWKFRVGDSPKAGASQTPLWAQPNYDDSGWQDYTIDPKHSKLDAVQAIQSAELPGWQQHGHPGTTGYAWYRFPLQIPPGTKTLALLMPQYVDDAYEVYVSGQKIGSFGRLDGSRVVYSNRPLVFPIPDSQLRSGEPVTLAIRFWSISYNAVPSNHNQAGGLRGVPLVGPSALLSVFQQNLREQQSQTQLAARWNAALYGAVGLISLFLFFFSRERREYLWAAIVLLSLGSFFMAGTLLTSLRISIMFFVAFLFLAFWIGISAASPAMMYLLRVPRNLWRRSAYAVSGLFAIALATEVTLVFGWLGATGGWERFSTVFAAIAAVALSLLLLGIIVDALRSHGRKAWVPLTPGLFLVGAFAAGIVSAIFPKLPGITAIQRGFLHCFPLAILVVFLVRFTRQERENATMTSELEAARSMQSLLVPAVPPSTPGFAVESVYLPASSVGGDFFQVRPGDDGSLLIVVGDVSGKGLKAAMTVSTIVGALRGCALQAPAEVLAYLNRVLHGQVGGFVTCCATLISSDGKLILANAGHLSPYRNGEELAAMGGLPLGIVADGSYQETHCNVLPGDRLTFMSDGVVEARNAKGELYGFERTQQISNLAAAAIAETARQFGQEDDITVVRVVRDGVLIPASNTLPRYIALVT